MVNPSKAIIVPVFLATLISCRPDGPLPVTRVSFGSAPPPPERTTVEEEELVAVATDPPDPEAIRTEYRVDLVLRYHSMQLSVEKERQHRASAPVTTSRRLGRFALEYWIGDELLERLRFDFPLLAVDSPDDVVEKGLDTRIQLDAPVVPRATRVRVLDRKTRAEWPMNLEVFASVIEEPGNSSD
ncbi:MAG: hypothetical protein MK135_06020 [Polyangiaceae bacterium]|nr:hypothetical protein [Polyangiaceae bacterium]